ncbi:unnamed protein product, partial [marine sediment metagenome]
KRPMPFLTKRIAVITSPTGAAIRDFLRISHRRMPNLDVTIVPVRVQGDAAAGDIVEALDLINKELDVDVIVLTRGGGSLEDLWAFNQEEVAYAIRRSKPRPKPEWITVPYLLRSRYHQYSAGSRLVSFILLSKVS